MRKLLLLLIFTVSASLLWAQHNIGTTYCEHNDMNASRYQPSELDFGNQHFQLGFNYDFWVGNTNIDYFELSNAFNNNELTQSDIERILDASSGTNKIGVGQNYQVIGVGVQFESKGGRKYDVAFTIVDKFGASIDISEEFLKFMLEGNNSLTFRGQTVNMGDTKMSALYTREYAVNVAMPLLFKDKDHKLRIGLRPKYIQGLANVNPNSSTVNMTTQADGEFIQMQYDYNYQTSGVSNFDPFKSNGNGFGIDLGITAFLSKNIEIVGSLLDIGSVTFSENTTSYQKSGTHRFEGVFIPNLLGTDPVDINFDEELSLYEPTIVEGESYSVALPAKLGLEFEYKTPEKKRRSKPKKNGSIEGDPGNISNTIYVTYIQGLNDQPGNTTRPFLSVGYMHDFHDYFDVGLSMAVGGFNNFAVGSFFAVNFGHHVKIGFSSDNIGALIIPKTTTGFDIATNFSLSF